jgi:hypothetical protein
VSCVSIWPAGFINGLAWSAVARRRADAGSCRRDAGAPSRHHLCNMARAALKGLVPSKRAPWPGAAIKAYLAYEELEVMPCEGGMRLMRHTAWYAVPLLQAERAGNLPGLLYQVRGSQLHLVASVQRQRPTAVGVVMRVCDVAVLAGHLQ